MAANGNLIFQDTNKATFVGANSNVVIDTVNASFGVGVDVNGPTSNLHVVGNAYVTSNLEVGTANLFVDTVNSRVGIGTTTPDETLSIYKEDTTAAGQTVISSITGVFSGSDAVTGGNINNRGLYINLDSSATGGTVTNSEEHRVWGIDVDIDVTGDSDDIKGGRFLVRSEMAANGTDQNTNIYGIDAQGQHNGSAPATNLIGVNARSLKSTSSTGLTDTMIGVQAEYEINAGTCTDAYGVRARFDRNGGAVSNSYIFYGEHLGSTTTITSNNYGLYVTGTDKHYLEGNVGIGTTDPVGVNGGNRLEGSSSTGFEYIATRNDTEVVNNDFMGAYLIKGTDTSGTEPHYAGMSASSNGTNSFFNLNFFSGRDNYENNTPQMVIDPDGNVGIGTDSPGNKFEVSGSSRFAVDVSSADNVIVGNKYSSGDSLSLVSLGSVNVCCDANGNSTGKVIDFRTNSYSNGGTLLMRIKDNGYVGIGTTSPSSFFHVFRDSSALGESADQDTHLKVETAGQVVIERKNGSTLVSKLYSTMGSSRPKWVYYYASNNYWQAGQSSLNVSGSNNNDFKFIWTTDIKAYIDASDGMVEINFTGQHRTFIDGVPTSKSGDFVGLVVSANKNKYMKMSKGVEMGSNAITINESLPLVSLSTIAHDKACFGVISDAEDSETRKDSFGSLVTVSNKEKGDTRVYINSVGEGAIWVTDINGPLESGDYITTSNVAGYGQKQDSDSLKNYTVAKITMDCDFDPVTQPVQIIRKELGDVNYWVKTTYENVTEEEYSNLDEESRRTITETVYTNEHGEIFTEQNEQSAYTERTQTLYQKITVEESKTEQEGYELEVRNEPVNVLDEHGQIQWEDDPSGATEKAYKIRYLDANGNITDEANHVHKAAFVGCTYHCG